MRDTPYATELRTVEDAAGQKIERLYVKELDREEIRFSWWKDGKLVVRPLDLPENELLALMNDAFAQGVFSEQFLLGLHSALSSHLESARYRASLEQLGSVSQGEHRRTRGLIEFLSRVEPIDEDWPDIDDPHPEPVEL